MPPLCALLYARVGSAAQKRKADAQTDEPSLAQQHAEMRREAERRNWPVIGEVEDVISGSVPLKDRPGGARLYQQAAAGAIDLVLVYDNDRIGRDQDALVAKLFRADMRFQRIQVFSVHQPFEPKPREGYDPYEDDAALRLESVSDTASSVAIRQLRRRLSFGLRQRVETKKLPVGRPPIGYLVDRLLLPNGRTVFGDWHVDPTLAPIVQCCFDLYEAGYSFFKIAGILNSEGLRTPFGNSWTRATLRGMIQNPVYFGAVVLYKRRALGNPHPTNPRRCLPTRQPREKWLIVEGAVAALPGDCPDPLRWGPDLRREPYAVGPCALWGLRGAMWRDNGWKGGYYNCSRWIQTGHAECASDPIHRLVLENHVPKYLDSLGKSPTALRRLTVRAVEKDFTALTDQARSLEAQLGTLQQRRQKAREAYEAEIDSLAEYAEHKEQLTRQQKTLERELERVRGELIVTGSNRNCTTLSPSS